MNSNMHLLSINNYTEAFALPSPLLKHSQKGFKDIIMRYVLIRQTAL